MSGAADAPRGLFDPVALRRALGRFTTGVTIVTCIDAAGERVGLTANSFQSLSLEPPLVLWSLRRVSPSLAAFEAAGHFAVNVLEESQIQLSRRFAAGGEDRFTEGDWSPGLHGAPVLQGCTAVFECIRLTRQDAGDHVLFVGQVLAYSQSAGAPLVYQAGHYRRLGPLL